MAKFRVTYATLSADNEELHAAYEEGVRTAKAWLGQTIPVVVDGQPRSDGETFTLHSPNDAKLELAAVDPPDRGDRDRIRLEAPDRSAVLTGASNVIPGELVVDFNFRFSTASTPQGLRERVEDVLRRHGVDFDIAWTLGGEPFLTPVGDLSEALGAAIEAERVEFRYDENGNRVGLTGGVPDIRPRRWPGARGRSRTTASWKSRRTSARPPRRSVTRPRRRR